MLRPKAGSKDPVRGRDYRVLQLSTIADYNPYDEAATSVAADPKSVMGSSATAGEEIVRSSE